MDEKDRVSVILPVFNRKEMVCEAIESVFGQSWKNFELIIADDGSTDGTADILRFYEDQDSVKVLYLDHNGNPGYVRNRAAETAEGTWLAFLDSDDLWMPDKLEKQMSILKNNRDISFLHSLEVWKQSGRIVSQNHRKHKKAGDLFEVSLGKCEIGPSTVVINRMIFESLGGFREDLEICEDYELWLRVTDKYPVAYIDEPLVEKRAGHGDQLSFKYGQIEIFKIKALQTLVDSGCFREKNQATARKELARKCRIYSSGCRKRNRLKEADEFEKLYLYYSGDDVENNE